MLDLAQAKDAQIEQRLRSELIIWLSTVRPDGRPHLVPVWFLWDGATFLIFSQPKDLKLRNLRQNPNVVLALETRAHGNEVVLIEGQAVVLGNPTLKTTMPEYAEKYAALMKSMDWTAEWMASRYSEVVRVTPTKFINWE
ncbi:MAG TPA: TIGR03667 family PPOX class F420-dependent oxidoreductase [Ktedonobacteraceae bacterium]